MKVSKRWKDLEKVWENTGGVRRSKNCRGEEEVAGGGRS